MARTQNGASGCSGSGSGCFSGIVKLLLCKGSLQTDPSDHEITEPRRTSLDQLNKVVTLTPPAAASAPGLVARLMGLDSLPVETNWVGPRGRRTPMENCVRRSRSVNFMDYLLELDFSQQREEEAQQHHRRLRTSVSFREVPELLTQGNQNLFVLYLNDSESTNSKRKPEMGGHKNREKPKRKENHVLKKNQPKEITRVSKLKDESRKLSKQHSSRLGSGKRMEVSSVSVSGSKKEGCQKSCQNSKGTTPMLKPINEKEVLVESKFMKKMKKKKKSNTSGDVESVFSSEGSSPVSVLDLKEPSSSDSELTFSEHERIKGSNSKKKPFHVIGTSGDLEPKIFKRRDRELHETHNEECYTELTRKLLEFTEKDVEESNWEGKASFKFEGSEEICSEIGHGILDLLLLQVVEELVALCI